MKIKTSRKAGFTLVEIMIVVAIIGLLAAIAIPNFVRARTQSQMNACINNLRQIDGAKQQWALENNQAPDATPGTDDLDDYLKRGNDIDSIFCPQDPATAWASSYTMGTVAEAPACLIDAANHVLQ